MDIVANRTSRDLWEDLAARSATQTFLVFEDRDGCCVEYTYGAFARRIDQTANLLRDLGVAKGDMVAVHLGNSPELLMCAFGAVALGAVCVPLHHRATRSECAEILARTRPRVVVCEPAMLDLYGRAPGRIDVPHVVVARSPEPVCGVPHFETERDRRPDRLVNPPPLGADDPAMMVFTSGTTACPKGVLLTHANLVFSGIYVDWQASLGPSDRLATTMPACHVNFLLNGLMPVLTAGATLVAIEKFHPSTFWRRVREHRATVVQAIAMMVRTMLLQPEADGERDDRVREILYYLPISDEQKQRFEERFGGRILNSYGNSECLVGAITDPPTGERRWPSIGRAGLGYEARIAGPDGQELPPHGEGEIQIRGVPGRTLMKEYYKDPKATAALYDADGWMHTGDLGHVDADGWFYFHDRMSLLIKRSGENVSPAEIEAVLMSHPQIAEASVVGVPDPIHDQAVKAVVAIVPGAALTAEDIQRHCREQLADFKVPTVVELVDALPRTASFKVARTSLDTSRGDAGTSPPQ